MSLLPLDDRDGVIWFDGKLVPWREAKIHVLTHGLHYGSSVFEGERAYGGKIFKSREHSERLHASARILDFTIPYTVDEIETAKQDLLKANKVVDGYLRPVAWRGSEALGISAPKNKIHLAIACWEWPSYFPPEIKAKGIKLMTSDWKRPAPDTAPTRAKAAGLYMICTLSKHKAEAQGFTDALMHDYQGRVAEATGANFFMVKDGKLHTPTPECILDGITRRTVMDLARRQGIEVVERTIMPDELKTAEEIFVTGSAAEVTPVGQIDAMTFAVGPMTRLLAEIYEKEVRG